MNDRWHVAIRSGNRYEVLEIHPIDTGAATVSVDETIGARPSAPQAPVRRCDVVRSGGDHIDEEHAKWNEG